MLTAAGQQARAFAPATCVTQRRPAALPVFARRAVIRCARVVDAHAALKPALCPARRCAVGIASAVSVTLATQASIAADLEAQSSFGFSTVEAIAASAGAAFAQAGFSALDVGAVGLGLILAVVAALASGDKTRLEATVAQLRTQLGATESAALAERLAAQELLSLRIAEAEAAVVSAVAAALERESERLRSEALAAAAAQAASEGLLNAAQIEEIRASVAAAREELAARERSIQAKSVAIEAKTNAIAKRLLQERDSVSAKVAEYEARAAAAESERAAAVRELNLVLESLGEARARAAAAEGELAKLRTSP